jgi:hypothetical protein
MVDSPFFNVHLLIALLLVSGQAGVLMLNWEEDSFVTLKLKENRMGNNV